MLLPTGLTSCASMVIAFLSVRMGPLQSRSATRAVLVSTVIFFLAVIAERRSYTSQNQLHRCQDRTTADELTTPASESGCWNRGFHPIAGISVRQQRGSL